MSDTWYAAFGLLTILCLVNALVLIALLRQVGVLHQRIRPIGPGIHEGPEPGTKLPRLELTPVSDPSASDPFAAPLTLLGYVAPECGVCRSLPSFLESFVKTKPSELEIAVALVTDAPLKQAATFAEEMNLNGDGHIPLYRHGSLESAYRVPGTPYVIALQSADGESSVVLAAGVVNELEQLEDLVEYAQVFRERADGTRPGPSSGPAAHEVPGGRRQRGESGTAIDQTPSMTVSIHH